MKTGTLKYALLSLAAALPALVLSACSKEETAQPADGAPIEFGVKTVAAQTRTEIADNDNISGKTIYVYGATSSTDWIYSAEPIAYSSTAKKWYPTDSKSIKSWNRSLTYQFYGFTYMPAGSSRVTFPTVYDKNLKKYVVSGYHKTFTIKQPDSYDKRDEMVDFLLSHTFNALGSARPIVQLQLEHAMALVDIYIVKHSSLGGRAVRVKSMTLTNVRTEATMTCTRQAIAGAGDTNDWQTNFIDHTPATYSTTEPLAVATEAKSTEAHMRIVAVPQQLDSTIKLTVVYEVDESADGEGGNEQMVEHSETFALYNYTPMVWESGHRIIYRATIDTGIHLQGQIAAWKDVDYIEGTVLPDIPDNPSDEETDDKEEIL